MKEEYTRPTLALIATVIIGLSALVLNGFNPMIPVVELILEVAA